MKDKKLTFAADSSDEVLTFTIDPNYYDEVLDEDLVPIDIVDTIIKADEDSSEPRFMRLQTGMKLIVKRQWFKTLLLLKTKTKLIEIFAREGNAFKRIGITSRRDPFVKWYKFWTWHRFIWPKFYEIEIYLDN